MANPAATSVMTTIHTIRLRGFWEVTPQPEGRTRHTRRFGKPRTLDANESLWLVSSTTHAVAVTLNGHPIGNASAYQPLAIDLTVNLQPRNEIAIDTQTDGELTDITLEIRQHAGT